VKIWEWPRTVCCEGAVSSGRPVEILGMRSPA
jgi:hypothetical protein